MKIATTVGLLAACAAAALVLAPTPAAAQEYQEYTARPQGGGSGTPIGLRLGYTSWEGLEQVHFGGHVLLGEITENVDLTPSLEIGTGNDLTVVIINGDLTYRFTELMSAPWGFYGGGSLSLVYLDADLGGSDADLGLSAVGGFTRTFDNGHEGRLEVRLGLLDYPGFKLTCGYTLF